MKFMKNIRIFYKILITSAIMLIFFIATFIAGSITTQNIYDNTKQYYSNSHKVTSAALEITTNIIHIHSTTHTLLEQSIPEDILLSLSRINEYESKSLDNLFVLESSFTGNMEKINQLRSTIIALIDVDQNVGQKVLSKDTVGSLILHSKQQDLITIASEQSEELRLIAEYEAYEIINEAQKNYTTQKTFFIISVIVTSLIIASMAYYLSISLSKPIKILIAEMEKSKNNQYIPKTDPERKDEFGFLSNTFIDMLNFVRKSHDEKLDMEISLRNTHKLESIGIMASGIAHEINNPINGIMNYSQLILDELPESSDIVLYANEIISESERISIIVKSLLNFSRAESNVFTKISIANLIDRVELLAKILIKKDNIDLSIDLQENLPALYCNPLQIQQVILNLITNSRSALNEKFIDASGEKQINISCHQFQNNNSDWIRFSVRDNGTGIDDELCDKIFDPFFTTKSRDRGTGLGLSISYGIIKDHGGNIYYNSVLGEFTEFIIELPVEGVDVIEN